MNWTQAAQGLNNLLCLVLLFRLFALKLHRDYSVYRVFAIFLIFEVISSLVTLIEYLVPQGVDYRLTWLVLLVIAWTIRVWMVYALLRAILMEFPGILRISKTILNFVFPLAVGIALLTTRGELSAAAVPGYTGLLDRAVSVSLVIERVVSTTVLLTLLLMLVFIFWFPVRMPRNLAAFSIGFVSYFTVDAALLLIHNFWSHTNFLLLDNGVEVVLSACYLYWVFLLTKEGETTPVTLGHSWRASHQVRLLGELEGINASLLRAARR